MGDTRNDPSAAVTIRRACPVSLLVTVTVVPCIAPPVWSCTVPFKEPTGTCARPRTTPHAAMHNNDPLSRTRLNMFPLQNVVRVNNARRVRLITVDLRCQGGCGSGVRTTLLSVNTPLAIFAGTAAPRIGLALSALHVAAAQTAPQGFLYKHLQSFGPEAKFTPQTRKQRLHA